MVSYFLILSQFLFSRWFGQERDYLVLVMDLLGPSIEDLFNFCSRKFSMKTVLMMADQVRYSQHLLVTDNLIGHESQPHNQLAGNNN